MKIRAFLLAFSFIVASVALGDAQVSPNTLKSKTSGISLGAYLNGSAIQIEDSRDIESGGGLALRIGYGFNGNFELFAEGTGAAIQYVDFDDTYTLGHFDLGMRYNFGSAQSAWRPNLEAALSGRAASMDVGFTTLDIRGSGFSLGGGIKYFLSPRLAIDGALKYMVGTFSEGKISGGSWQNLGSDQFSATSTRVNFGLTFHP